MSSQPISEDTVYKEFYTRLRATDDISFKLLGLVPLLSGTGTLGLFWSKGSLPSVVVWLIALFGGSVTLGLFRWELCNIRVCWWLLERVEALESRVAGITHGDHVQLSKLRPPFGIDKPHAEALVYGATIFVWLVVPGLHSWPPSSVYWLTALYLTVSVLIGILTLLSVLEVVITHHWPRSRWVEQKVTYILEQQGKVLLIENVPARVCVETGERVFAPEIVERLQQIVWDQRTPTRVVETPVCEFAS